MTDSIPGSQDTSIDCSDVANPALRIDVQVWLRGYNDEHPDAPPRPAGVPLSVRALSSDGTLVGGLTADTYWGWLVVDVLAVDPARRGLGIGRRLVEAAEQTALSRGCHHVQTYAWPYQGLPFWLHIGYQTVGTLEGYPEGHTHHWLRRDLDAPRPAADE